MKDSWLKKTVELNQKHIEIINGELGDVQRNIATLKNDVKWIKLLLLPIFTGVIALVFKIFLL